MAVKIKMEPSHPGVFLRRSVIPEGLSVTDAANLLKVGRPALSKLLNGKSSISPEMALRMEKAFGMKMDLLLGMQAKYDAFQMRKKADTILVNPFKLVMV